MVRATTFIARSCLALLLASACTSVPVSAQEAGDPLAKRISAQDTVAPATNPAPSEPNAPADRANPVPTGPNAPAGFPSDPVPQTPAELRSALAKILDETGTPGVAAAVVTSDEFLFLGGAGVAGRDRRTPVDGDTLFGFGSISKTLVALAVLDLVEAGRLDLQTPVRDLAPEIAFTNPFADTHPLRLVHLLEHTAGFPEIHLSEWAVQDPDLTLAQALAVHPASRICRWPPGTHYSYTNSGPAMAAYIVEKTTGRPFEELARETLLAPLHMPSTAWRPTPRNRPRLAACYHANGRTPLPYHHFLFRPTGSLISSAREMGHLVQMLLQRGTFAGTRLFEPHTIDRLESPSTGLTVQHGLTAGYGLGNYLTLRDGFRFHGHAGNLAGYWGNYAYLPQHRIGYLFVINALNGPAFSRIDRLLRSFVTRDLPAPPKQPTAAVPPESLEPILGAYEPLTLRNELDRGLLRLGAGILQVRRHEGYLYLLAPGFIPLEKLAPVTARTFRQPDAAQPTVAFVEQDGQTLMLWANGAVSATYRKISATQHWLRWAAAALCLLLLLSAPIFGLVWGARKLLGHMKDTSHLSVRLLPLMAVLILAADTVLFGVASMDVYARLGRPTAWAWSLLLLQWAFLAVSVAALIHTLRSFRLSIHRGVWIHSLLVSLAACLTGFYLAWWGLLGWPTWM